jgi:hypothetical protein
VSYIALDDRSTCPDRQIPKPFSWSLQMLDLRKLTQGTKTVLNGPKKKTKKKLQIHNPDLATHKSAVLKTGKITGIKTNQSWTLRCKVM